jgi:hypothetical protein
MLQMEHRTPLLNTSGSLNSNRAYGILCLIRADRIAPPSEMVPFNNKSGHEILLLELIRGPATKY